MLSPNKLSEKLLRFRRLFFLFLEWVLASCQPVVFLKAVNFMVNFTVDGMQLILHHNLQVAVRNPIHHIVVRQMQVFNERRYLTQQALVAYRCRLGFAISFPTFFAKADSIVKFWVFTIL